MLNILEWLGFYKSLEYQHKRFELLAKRCESPIEKAFWSVGYFELSELGEFTPQVNVGPFRIDFGLTNIREAPMLKIAIELDGHESHKTKEQRNHDTERERYLMKNGWQVIRFTGSQIVQDTSACVLESKYLVKTIIKKEQR